MISRLTATVFTFTLAAGLAVAFSAGSAGAQEAISLEQGEPYVHPHSGITVPANLGGIMPRRVIAFAPAALDVGLSYDTAENTEALSIYVFRRTNGDVPVWFAQAQSALEGRDKFAGLTVFAAPAAFAPPGQAEASGLRAAYAIEGGAYRSTGLAVFAVNGWYVKMRASSKTRSAEELHGWMDEVLAQLTVPANEPEASANIAAPVLDCAQKLRFRGKAKDAPGDETGSAMASLLGGLLMSAGEEIGTDEAAGDAALVTEPVIWCRDQQIDMARATYRANASPDSYLLALGDNGNGVSVGPDGLAAIFADTKKSPPYSITLMTAGRNISFVSQNRLPSPSRVIELIEGNRTLGVSSTWGEERNIEINLRASE